MSKKDPLKLVDEGQELTKILTDAGYEVVSGPEAVNQMIKDKAGSDTQWLCSGWGVFPDGTVCKGCSDCANSIGVTLIN